MRITAFFAVACLSVVSLAASIPLPEHPRPDWERAEWLNLNGEWDFGFAPDKLGVIIQADVPCAWGDAGEKMFEEHLNALRRW